MTASVKILKTSVSSSGAMTNLLNITDPELLQCTSECVMVPY
jgi:hypothetical protein